MPPSKFGGKHEGVYKNLTEAGWWKGGSGGGSGRQRPGTSWRGPVSWLGPRDDVLPTTLQSKYGPPVVHRPRAPTLVTKSCPSSREGQAEDWA